MISHTAVQDDLSLKLLIIIDNVSIALFFRLHKVTAFDNVQVGPYQATGRGQSFFFSFFLCRVTTIITLIIFVTMGRGGGGGALINSLVCW